MTHGEQLMFAWWGLFSQVIGMVTGIGAVVVAIVFGGLTLRATRTADDASERASIASTTETSLSPDDLARIGRIAAGLTALPGGIETRGGATAGGTPPPPSRPAQTVRWRLQHRGGVVWDLYNVGDARAYDVTLEGLTTQDRQRIKSEPSTTNVEPGNLVTFTMFTAFSMSGVATLVISWSRTSGGPHETKRLPVVAPS